MEVLKIDATKFTPDIVFDFENGLLEMKGKSYPPSTGEFYLPILERIENYVEQLEDGKQFVVNIELRYFNSGSARILIDLFDMFEQAANKGKNITVNWISVKDDLDNVEYGEEFKEDLKSLAFNLVQKE